MSMGGATTYRAFNGAATFSLDSMAVNETLSLTFDLQFDFDPSEALSWNFGFVNADGSNNSIAYVNADMSSTVDPLSSFRYRTGSYNMSRGTAGVVAVGSSFVHPALAEDTGYFVEFSVTKNALGNYDLVYSIDSTIVSSQTIDAVDIATSGVAISGIAFRHGSGGGTTYLDNVSVSLAPIPEPSSAALFFGVLALGSLAFWRRR